MQPQSDQGSVKFGILTAIASACAFGINTVLARVSYLGGGNPITYAVVRTVTLLLITILLLHLMKRDWRIPRAGFGSASYVAVCLAGLSIGLLSAIQYIPISMAILIMYLSPILVVIIESLSLGRIPKGLQIIACICAFVGLFLVLGPTFNSLDWRGIAFALLACFSVTSLTLTLRAARGHSNELAVMLWAGAGSLPLIALCWPLMGGIQFPVTSIGWTAFTTGCLAFVIAFSCYVISLRHIQASRAAILYNFEPLVTLVGAAVLLNEAMTLTQMAGASLVIIAVMMAAR